MPILRIDSKQAADIALKKRLYVSGWCLSDELKSARVDTEQKFSVHLYEEEGIPVGVAVITKYDELQVFVRKSHRRRGIGSKLVASIRTNKCRASKGIDGSLEFFEKQSIPVFAW